MKYYLLRISSLNITVKINEKEASLIANTPNDQAVAISRLNLMAQKRFCEIMPASHPDIIEDRKKQQTGILHDGSKAKKHFGQWVADLGEVPDDSGNYHPVKLDAQYYPEIALDITATKEEWMEIKKTGKDYYEFLGIDKNIKRLNKGFTKLIE